MSFKKIMIVRPADYFLDALTGPSHNFLTSNRRSFWRIYAMNVLFEISETIITNGYDAEVLNLFTPMAPEKELEDCKVVLDSVKSINMGYKTAPAFDEWFTVWKSIKNQDQSMSKNECLKRVNRLIAENRHLAVLEDSIVNSAKILRAYPLAKTIVLVEKQHPHSVLFKMLPKKKIFY